MSRNRPQAQPCTACGQETACGYYDGDRPHQPLVHMALGLLELARLFGPPHPPKPIFSSKAPQRGSPVRFRKVGTTLRKGIPLSR